MKITKNQIDKIKNGNHAILMDCLNYLLDIYDEHKFDMGYESCLADIGVRSKLLAEAIVKEAKNKGQFALRRGERYYTLQEDELSEFIEEYFNKFIHNKFKTDKHGRKQKFF